VTEAQIGEIVTNIATTGLMLIMFSMGIMLRVRDFLNVVKTPLASLLGLIGQILLLPIIAFGICYLMELPSLLAIGLMVLSACPGGPTSNAISMIAGGDTALSITLTALSGIVAFITAPLVMSFSLTYFEMAGVQLELPFIETSMRIFFTTVVPVCLGMYLSGKFLTLENYRQTIFRFGFGLVITTSLLLLVARSELLGSAQAMFAALALNVSMMGLAYLLGNLLLKQETQVRTITVEVGLQNVSLAIVVILTMLEIPEMLTPTLFYLPIAYVTGFGFAYLMRKRDHQPVEA
jgi:BASS family bile acid:Na+ symporter|tara:strand:- start:1809 stop:2684 length:876 start_codon:yes stop_codon:yes gene_type:complete